jgi:2'-5' RNA ligase
MSSVRAFLGVPLTTELQEAIRSLQSGLMSRITGIRWSRPENLHLTLHFFGETAQENLEKIRVSMLSVKHCHRPFQVDVIGLGAFPSLRRPRVIWLGLNPQNRLRQLHRDCHRALHEAGFVIDSRPYSPHLTIGRAKHRVNELTALGNELDNQLIGHLPIDSLILYESRLSPAGAKHIPLLTIGFDNETDDSREQPDISM